MIPTVSVIIPTRNRPGQLVAAVRSVLAQRLESPDTLEVIAVIDGPDNATVNALTGIADSRVRTIQLPTQRGHATARNAGIAKALGHWSAFLDDDDLWYPEKLTTQLMTARKALDQGIIHPIVGCIVCAKAHDAEMLWPVRVPLNSEPIAEYLYARSGWRSILSGHTLLQTSMILLQTDIARRVGFRGGMRRHADPDWFLRLQRIEGVRFLFPETSTPLADWNIAGSNRVSSSGDYRYSMLWARRHAKDLGPRAMAGFLTGPAAHIASHIPVSSYRRRAFAVLLRETVDTGDPSIWDFAAILVKYLRIQDWRKRLRAPMTTRVSR